MIYDPLTTLVVYIGGICLILTLVAAIADYSLARTERKLRDQARAEARAERKIGERSSVAEWQ